MTDERLAKLYRRLHAATPAPDAAQVTAALEGKADEAALVEIARSNAASDALRISMALEADVAALSAALSPAEAGRDETRRASHGDRSREIRRGESRGRVARWAAMAAAVAFGFALFLDRGVVEPVAPVANGPASVEGDRILAGDFETRPDERGGDDALFVDDFGA